MCTGWEGEGVFSFPAGAQVGIRYSERTVMIIVNLLPLVSKVCVCTTDKSRQSVIEELHIDPWESEVRQLCLG